MSNNCFIFLVLGMILLLTSCARKEITARSEPQDRYIRNVTFVKQKDKYCGPSAMASVLQFHGQDIDQDEIAEVIYIPELNGALISDMENYALSNGYHVESTNGNLESLKSNIDIGNPVILLVDKGKWKVSVPHYYVAYGYNEQKETVILHTGYKQNQDIGYEQLEKEWQKMNNLMLVITR
jgi:ABC-type bacteriocin/lantibiotic exporter with double-glycine peptidase domain